MGADFVSASSGSSAAGARTAELASPTISSPAATRSSEASPAGSDPDSGVSSRSGEATQIQSSRTQRSRGSSEGTGQQAEQSDKDGSSETRGDGSSKIRDDAECDTVTDRAGSPDLAVLASTPASVVPDAAVLAALMRGGTQSIASEALLDAEVIAISAALERGLRSEVGSYLEQATAAQVRFLFLSYPPACYFNTIAAIKLYGCV
jgi:hypothetical protein